MTRLIGSEIFKLRTTRTFYGLVGSSLGLVMLIVILVSALVNFSPSDQPLNDMMNVAGFVQVFALVLGILAVTSEFRHGTITPSLLVIPDRIRLTLAKLIAGLGVGVALGLLATVLVVVVVKLIGGVRDLDTSGDALALIVGGTIATGLYAALGVGIGAVIRNQVGAIIGALVYVFVLEPLAQLIPKANDVFAKYGLGGVSAALSGIRNEESDVELLGQVAGGLLFAGYVAVLIGIGLVLMRRRDVTA